MGEKRIYQKSLKKIFWMCILTCILGCTIFLSSCGVEDKDEKKEKNLDFTVVSDENLPKELMEIINQKKSQEMRLTFGDKENLYIIVGYGKQPTGGYSISVEDLYETKNSVCIYTKFIGPSKTEVVTQAVSYPYIVVKIEYTDKAVIFNEAS